MRRHARGSDHPALWHRLDTEGKTLDRWVQMSWLKKGVEEPTKRKRWQGTDDAEEEEDDGAEAAELVCVECAAPPQIMCTSCSGYHCTHCFSSTHAEDGAKAECEARYRVMVRYFGHAGRPLSVDLLNPRVELPAAAPGDPDVAFAVSRAHPAKHTPADQNIRRR